MKQAFSTIAGWALNVLLLLWVILPKAIDWVGRSTLPDDWEQLMTEKLPKWADWLFSTPWYVPALLATGLTIWLMWVSRSKLNPALNYQQSHGDSPSGRTSDLDNLVDLEHESLADARIRIALDSKGMPRSAGHSGFAGWYLQHTDILGKRVASTVFIAFEKNTATSNVTINGFGNELPRFEVRDRSNRSLVIVFDGALSTPEFEIVTTGAKLSTQ